MNSLLTESPPQSQRPDILQVIGARVALRRAGKQFNGLCPLHGENSPSFSVSGEKQLFFCHGCHAGGDVINFVMLADKLTFPQALKALGMDGNRPPAPKPTANRMRAAELAVAWSNEQRAKLNTMLADAMEQRDLADEIDDFKLAEIFDRELVMLREFYDALEYPSGVIELLGVGEGLEEITAGAGEAL